MNFFVNRGILAVLLLGTLSSCNRNKTLFTSIPSEQSGIHFNNSIPDNDSFNIIKHQNVYNGGGVGIGDFNNDGLQDIYFTGNMVPNKLYLNKGGFSFQDITAEANVGGEGEWSRGVAVIDINNDGWLDIYVCATMKSDASRRRNLLYINQKADKNGVPHFKEMSAEYGLNDTSYSTMASFFDYDNDGDLDMYLVVNQIDPGENPDYFRPIVRDGTGHSTGRLYRNDWSDSLKHPVFTDVSRKAGLNIEGYGHDVTIADINQDGWKDIYVSNDFVSNDLLYINNHDGTFTDKSKSYFKHTSANGMGQDIEDINNDGLADIVELDMSPNDNYRKKMMLNGNRYLNYQNSDQFGYTYQYVRNNLQLNLGPRINGNDSIGDPVFADIGFYSGIAETDWSWTPMVTDFDNDGFRDIIITNGFPKDVTDHDFMAFRNMSSNLISNMQTLSQIPEVRLHKFAYRNNGDLSFSDKSADWGFTDKTFSNGAAYADLDNDGAMDVVINNINGEASVYRNTSLDGDKKKHHYLNIQFVGDSLNRNGLGAMAELHYDGGKLQVYENTPYRGYLSTIQNIGHFGLGAVASVDSVIIKWPNKKMQLLRNVASDQLLKVDVRQATDLYVFSKNLVNPNVAFSDITDSTGISFHHQERDFIDFNVQKLLPHKFTQYGPAIAVGDVDGNGLDDMIIGGAAFHSAQIFLQQANGKFIQTALVPDSLTVAKLAEDEGILLFDADGDGDLDLFIASGGYQNPHNNAAYQDKLYINDGKGHFTSDPAALPTNFTSKFCVRAADYDHDGDLDLFISGRVDPGNYPKPVSSFIYRNDSKNGHVKFTDVTSQVAGDLLNAGMVCDAVWTDFDNDGWPDLILAGEWMPVTFLKNNHGTFKNITGSSGIQNQTGWWNSITCGDFDNDGRMDYIVGNLGQNSFYRATDEYPARVYGGDFDNNGIYDMMTSLYLPDSNGIKREFPSETRDDLLKQVNAFRRTFPNYKSYAIATMDEVLTDEQRKKALILKANNFQSSFIHNEGNGKFSMRALPKEAQFSAINGMVVEDFNGDGNLDLLMNTNDFSTEVSVGRYDAMNGLYLMGDGKGNFKPQSILESGIFIPGNGKALVKLKGATGNYLIAASQNRGPLKIYKLRKSVRSMPLMPADVKVLIQYKNGNKRMQETYYGNSFLSQSARFLKLEDQMKSVEISDARGNKRTIAVQ